jgi:hypothetical protein
MRTIALLTLAALFPTASIPSASTSSSLPGGTPPSIGFAGATGPAWVSIEYPVNPHDATTRNAFLLVHAFHHGTPMAFPVSGTAEGIVNGERRSVRLEFTRNSRNGVYALARQWPVEGTWTLAIAVTQGKDDRAWALVELARSGEVASVRVPTRRQDQWTIPTDVAMSEIDAGLRERAAQLARAPR